jgi:ribosomal protein L4
VRASSVKTTFSAFIRSTGFNELIVCERMLNPVDLINAEKVVFTEDALTSLAEVLS